MPGGRPKPEQGTGGIVAAAGVVLLAVACCAGPALLAGGGLALAGGVLRSPVVAVPGALVLAGAVVYALRRQARADAGSAGMAGSTGRARSEAEEDCCAPPSDCPGQSVGRQGPAHPVQERGDRP